MSSFESTLARMKDLYTYGKELNESSKAPVYTLEHSAKAADGKTYGIIRECNKYYIKSAPKGKERIAEAYDYLGGICNKKNYEYTSYNNALKNFELKMASINEACDGNVNISTLDPFKKGDFIVEGTEKMRNEIARQRQIMYNASMIMNESTGIGADRENDVVRNNDKNPEAPTGKKGDECVTDKKANVNPAYAGSKTKGLKTSVTPFDTKIQEGCECGDVCNAEDDWASRGMCKGKDPKSLGWNIDGQTKVNEEEGDWASKGLPSSAGVGVANTSKNNAPFNKTINEEDDLMANEEGLMMNEEDDLDFGYNDDEFDGEEGFEDDEFGGEEDFEGDEFDGEEDFEDDEFDGEEEDFEDDEFDGEEGFEDDEFDGEEGFEDDEFDGEEGFEDDEFDGEEDFEGDEFDGEFDGEEEGFEDDGFGGEFDDEEEDFEDDGFGGEFDDEEEDFEDDEFDSELNEILDANVSVGSNNNLANGNTDSGNGNTATIPLGESKRRKMNSIVESVVKDILSEDELHVFGKHPGYQKKPMDLPTTGADKNQWGEDWNDESVYSEQPFGTQKGSSAPFEKLVDTVTKSVMSKLSEMTNKKKVK